MIRSFNGKTPKIAESAFISEAAYVVGDVHIAEDSSVWPGAIVRGDHGAIAIGKSTTVEDACVIHSGTPALPIGDVVIGDNVHIGHGAVVNCRKIGNNVLIGMNATVLHDVEIGDFCIIGAGSLVSQGMKIPDRSFVVGVTAKVKGKLAAKHSYWVEEASQHYVDLAKQYKKEGL